MKMVECITKTHGLAKDIPWLKIIRGITHELKLRFPWICNDELESAAGYGVWVAYLKYKPGGNISLRTYINIKSVYLAIDSLKSLSILRRKGRRSFQVVYSSELTEDAKTKDTSVNDIDAADFIEKVLSRCQDERTLRIAKQVFIEGKKQTEVAKTEGVSAALTSLIINQVRDTLYSALINEG